MSEGRSSGQDPERVNNDGKNPVLVVGNEPQNSKLESEVRKVQNITSASNRDECAARLHDVLENDKQMAFLVGQIVSMEAEMSKESRSFNVLFTSKAPLQNNWTKY